MRNSKLHAAQTYQVVTMPFNARWRVSFFNLVVINWDKRFEEAAKAVDNFGNPDGIPFTVFQQKQRDRWAFFLDAEQVCVQSQLTKLSLK
jgi:hypothetical protein